MANHEGLGGGTPSTRGDEIRSVDAGTESDGELDSTGAGSPPAAAFEGALHDQAAPEHDHPRPAHPASQQSDPCPMETAAPSSEVRRSNAALEAALGEILVISGGSGYNDLVGATPGATYVMPISDNGGSSSEIIRVLGGPSIGDLRSRLNRLIPTPSRYDATSSSSIPPQSNEAIHKLLSHRLPSQGASREIKQEWMDILEGRHRLWRGIEPERKEVIRGFLVQFESEVLRRAHRHFNFRGGSIGNFFLAAAQKFFRSIQSAIFLFSATTQISTSLLASKVLPVINTNHTATIAAELEDGQMIVGQCEISHPAPKPQRPSRVPEIAIAPSMEKSRSLASQPPGTPSSAVWEDRQPMASQDAMPGVDAMQGLMLADGGMVTPGFGPPAHYHINEPFGPSNYTSMNASVDVLGVHPCDADTPESGSSRLGVAAPSGGKSKGGPSPLFAQLVDERAAAYNAQTRKGLTTVGNHKDGLDPEDDDQDSQDGLDQADSPRESSDGAERSTASLHNHAGATTDSMAKRSDRARWKAKENTGNILFSKPDDDQAAESALASPIRRVLYVNAYRNEIYPAPNPAFVNALGRSQTLIYSCGSLWTSIMPCVALRNIATSIATSPGLKYKVLLLNSVHDRETRGMHALDVVNALCSSLNQSDHPSHHHPHPANSHSWPPNLLISHLVYFPHGQLKVDTHRLEQMGIRCVAAHSRLTTKTGAPKFDEQSVRDALHRITTGSE